MDNLLPFYTPIGLKSLELLEYFMNDLLSLKKTGQKVEDYGEKLKLIKDLKKLFNDRAIKRKEFAEIEQKEKEYWLEQRTHITCPGCNKDTTALILDKRIKTNENRDELKFDLLQCPLCNHEFESEYPNNRVDMVKHHDNTIEKLKYILDQKNVLGVSAEDEKNIITGIKDLEGLRKRDFNLVECIQKFYKTMEDIDKDEEEIYNKLYLAKITGTMWEGADGLMN